jgi:hypothetical protein
VIGLPYRFLHLHNWDSMALAYLALYCAVRFWESPNACWAFVTGTLVSLTALFEHSARGWLWDSFRSPSGRGEGRLSHRDASPRWCGFCGHSSGHCIFWFTAPRADDRGLDGRFTTQNRTVPYG